MWFDEDINLTIETDSVINVSGAVEFSNIDTVTVHEFEQPIIIQTSEYFAPVQSVNGKVGFVNLTAEDLGISSLDASTFVNITGNQTVNGIKNFTSRPTVNGTGVLLNGEAVNLPNTILYTTGNQIKSGRLIIGNDAISIVDPNSQYTLSLQTNSPATWLEILNNSGANKGVFFGIQDNDFEQYNWQGGDITFFTAENVEAGYARLTIKNDGKVGIGTSSPSEKLEVNGNIKASGASFNNRPTVNGSGVLLSGEAYPSNNPSNFISSDPPTGSVPLDLLIKYVTGINVGTTSYEGVFPNIYFTENPVLFISLSYESTEITSINEIAGKNRYLIDLAYRNQTGFGVVFSDQISETGINLNVLAYGKGVNL